MMSLSSIAPTPPFLYAVAKYTMRFLARRTVRFCIAKERIYANPEQTDARLDANTMDSCEASSQQRSITLSEYQYLHEESNFR